MRTEIPVEKLLRWRLERAETEAPPAPRASDLLDAARPWWETWPEQFHAWAGRLGAIQVTFGHAMSEPVPSRTGHPVPTLLIRSVEERETSARALLLQVRDGWLRLRFDLESTSGPVTESFEVTFLSESESRPLFTACATGSVDGEYRVETRLPAEIAAEWKRLKVTDRMPFRLILRSDTTVP